MGCECIRVDDYDGPSLCETTYPTARKAHKCVECGRTIQPGEKYERTKGVWEGEFSTFKTCKGCLELRRAYMCNGWMYGEILNDIIDYGSDGACCLDGLSPEAIEVFDCCILPKIKAVEAA